MTTGACGCRVEPESIGYKTGLRIAYCATHRIASALAWEALEETAKFLSKVDWMFDHSGAMNATQLARRDRYLRTRKAVHTALAAATPEGA